MNATIFVVLFCLFTAFKPSAATPERLSSNDSFIPCGDLHKINASDRCEFVTNASDCQIEDGYIPYIRFPYCTLNGQVAASVVVFALWLSYLFVNVALTVKYYLVPSLDTISKTLRLSESVAGVTFLALGNGAADIFSLVVLMTKVDNDGSFADTAMGAILGGGLFVTSIVAGLITFFYSMGIRLWVFLRDTLFYLGAIVWLVVMIADGEISLAEALGFVGFYVCYVVLVIVSLKFEKGETSEEKKGLLSEESNGSSTDSENFDESTDESKPKSPDQTIIISRDIERSQSEIEDSVTDVKGPAVPTRKDKEKVSVSQLSKLQFRQLLNALWPHTWKDFKALPWYSKIVLVLQEPVRFLLTLTTPVVDYKKPPNHGWNRLLMMFNLLLGPTLAAVAFDFFFQEVKDGLIVGLISLAVSTALALFVALTTYTDEPPRFHWVFAFLGFVMSIVWIYIIANEVVNVLEAIGDMLQLSGALLGLIVLAGGNSVCDLIANFLVAKEGKPIMGFSASYGSPLLNMLIGVGLSCILAIIKNGGPYKVKLTAQLSVASGFLLFSVALATVVVTLRRRQADRVLGIPLIISYIIFIIVLLCVEFA